MMFVFKEQEHHLDISIHAPDEANALGLHGARELAAGQKQFRKFRKPVVVRSLHPTVFCAGGNLTEHAKLTNKGEGLRANREITRILNAFAKWPVPKIAVVDGHTLGGGVEWLGRFDFRWATERAEFTFRQKRVGLSFGWGGGAAWSRWLGETRVRQLLLEARTLGPDEALRIGLVDRVLNSGEVETSLARWLKDVASPIDSVIQTWSVRSEARLFRRLWWGDAHRAALARWRARSSKV